MSEVRAGRWTVDIDGDFVVFIIGARVGNPFKAVRAIPLLAQMPRMLADLSKDPDKGLLAYQQHGPPVFGVIVQYWRSFEDLERFARNPGDRHAKVWRDWFRLGQHRNNSTGIWHETYKVHAGEYEAIYQGVRDIGLLKAGQPTPIGARSDSAAERIGAPASELLPPTQA